MSYDVKFLSKAGLGIWLRHEQVRAPGFCAIEYVYSVNGYKGPANSPPGWYNGDVARPGGVIGFLKYVIAQSAGQRAKYIFSDVIEGVISTYIINELDDNQVFTFNGAKYRVRKLPAYNNPNTDRRVQEMWVVRLQGKGNSAPSFLVDKEEAANERTSSVENVAVRTRGV